MWLENASKCIWEITELLSTGNYCGLTTEMNKHVVFILKFSLFLNWNRLFEDVTDKARGLFKLVLEFSWQGKNTPKLFENLLGRAKQRWDLYILHTFIHSYWMTKSHTGIETCWSSFPKCTALQVWRGLQLAVMTHLGRGADSAFLLSEASSRCVIWIK